MANPGTRKSLSILNLLVYVLMVVVNALANILPINGVNTGELSDLYPNLFVPAGLTFAIWGLIYLLLLIYVIYGLIRAFGSDPLAAAFIEKISFWFILASVANASWIFAWHYKIVPLSLIIMLVLLISLIMIYQKLEIGRTSASGQEKFLVHLPMSVYLGWISIATIANVTTFLVDAGWGGFGIGEQVWAIIMIVIAFLLTTVMLFSRRDIFYALVVIWALLGINLKQSGGEFGSIATVALVGLILLGSFVIAQIVRKKVYA